MTRDELVKEALRLAEDALRSQYPRVPYGTPTKQERRRRALAAVREARQALDEQER